MRGLSSEPLAGRPLRGRMRHLRSLRVGVYRIVYRHGASKREVIIETIRHRSEAYR